MSGIVAIGWMVREPFLMPQLRITGKKFRSVTFHKAFGRGPRRMSDGAMLEAKVKDGIAIFRSRSGRGKG
jgi:hypothetical protein